MQTIDREEAIHHGTRIEWVIRTEGDGAEVLASLECRHNGKPDYGVRAPYTYTATLSRRNVLRTEGMIRESFDISGKALPDVEVLRWSDAKRYSVKQLHQFVSDALSQLDDERRMGSDAIEAIFDPEQ